MRKEKGLLEFSRHVSLGEDDSVCMIVLFNHQEYQHNITLLFISGI